MKHICLLGTFLSMFGITFSQPVLDFQELNLSGPAISAPVDITGAGDGSGRLFVVEKGGTIRIIENNTVLPDYFLDISSQVEDGGERGLLGLAFHPNFPAEPYLYVNYVGLAGPDTTYISRFRVNPADPNDAQESSELVMLKARQPYSNHNAGDLAFSPIDGYLYIPMGDGGLGGDPEESGQDSMSLLGKILRLDVDANPPYVPADNPYVNNPNILDEIWAFGVRNPWRASFDRVTGDYWIGDVGQNMWEEVNFQPASSIGGENYGWDCYEGNHLFEATDCASASSYVFPVFEYPHNCSQGCPLGTGNSLTGGFVYRGTDYPTLQGYYICADYGSENIWLIDQSFNVSMQSGSGVFNQLSTFGEDDDGELYAADLDGSDIFKVTVAGVLPLYFIAFDATRSMDIVQLQWRIETTDVVASFEVQRSATAFVSYETIGTLVPENKEAAFFSFDDEAPLDISAYYRIRAILEDGEERLSPILSSPLEGRAQSLSVHTTDEGYLMVRSDILHPEIDLEIYLTDGTLVLSRETALASEQVIPGTKDLSTGMYIVSLNGLPSGAMAFKWFKS